LPIDSKHWFTDFTFGFVGRRLGVIWPQLYYHFSSVRLVYARIILIWQPNENYQNLFLYVSHIKTRILNYVFDKLVITINNKWWLDIDVNNIQQIW